LPLREDQERHLHELAAETQREGGSARVMTVLSQSKQEHAEFRDLFSRSEAWAQFGVELASAHRDLAAQSPTDINRAMRKLRREYEAIAAIDYFPGPASAAALTAWKDYLHAAESLLSPGEPSAASLQIELLDTAGFQGRRWATRKHLWVDRVASAWLIRRFIDRKAKFLWLKSPDDCPKNALGFDFDGAAFSHVGERVTFEVLLASFGLEGDHALMRLGAMVHALDVGGAATPEAGGFEAILAGARKRLADDDALLAEISTVLDSLYVHFSGSRKP